MWELFGSIFFIGYILLCIVVAIEKLLKFLGCLLTDSKDSNKTPTDTKQSVTPLIKNPPRYSVAELQQHLDNYLRKAILNEQKNSRNRDNWKYGRDYERYVGYLFECQNFTVRYNGATLGTSDDGIDLFCFDGVKLCVVQCKRWKNKVDSETIEQFHDAFKRFNRNRDVWDDFSDLRYSYAVPVFYSVNGFTNGALLLAKKYGMECITENFQSVKKYPPVKCINSHGVKIYFLPFDKGFDKVPSNFDSLICHKFTVYEAERAGYRYVHNSA